MKKKQKQKQQPQESLKVFVEKGPPAMQWAVPAELGIPPDPLRIRLDFHHQSVTLTEFKGETVTTRIVSAHDVATALASELNMGSGLLPDNTLWWKNTRSGPVYAIYVEPGIRKVAVQFDINIPVKRFTIPLPGLIFLCSPGSEPWVYAVKEKPTKGNDEVFKAPLLNIFANGRSCPGSNKYPAKVSDIIQTFWISFFSNAADVSHRSKNYPQNVLKLWEYLNGNDKFPLEDLVMHGRVADLLQMEMGR
jgi:hypothetical protein